MSSERIDPTTLDAPDYLGALTPPVFRSGARVFVGRLLSLEEWLPFEIRMQGLTGPVHPSLISRYVRDVTDALFPPPSWWALRRGGPGAVRVSDLVVRLPDAARTRVLMDFLTAQRAGNELPTAGPTDAPSSPPPEPRDESPTASTAVTADSPSAP